MEERRRERARRREEMPAPAIRIGFRGGVMVAGLRCGQCGGSLTGEVWH